MKSESEINIRREYIIRKCKRERERERKREKERERERERRNEDQKMREDKQDIIINYFINFFY